MGKKRLDTKDELAIIVSRGFCIAILILDIIEEQKAV